jgi:hypothetical protein
LHNVVDDQLNIIFGLTVEGGSKKINLNKTLPFMREPGFITYRSLAEYIESKNLHLKDGNLITIRDLVNVLENNLNISEDTYYGNILDEDSEIVQNLYDLL